MNEHAQLRRQVCDANRALASSGLVTLTWGNVSAISDDRTVVAIKPSGVDYTTLSPDQIVLVDLDARPLGDQLRPSTDTPTHIEIYRAFRTARAVVHTHSFYATMFAQARAEILCLGTTHADHFAGPVPLTRQLTPAELDDYERSTGRVIIERFASLDPDAIPGVLVAGHAPFVWGASVAKALDNAIALEAIARLAHGTLSLDPHAPTLEPHVLRKHHQRKHGPDRYYGQP